MRSKLKLVAYCASLLIVASAIAFAVSQSLVRDSSAKQTSYQAGVTIYEQPQGWKVLQPDQEIYLKIGTIGHSESAPCVAATWVYDVNAGHAAEQAEFQAYCRIESSGYAAVTFKNKGKVPLAIYHTTRIAVMGQ